MMEVSCQILPILPLVLSPEDIKQVKDIVIMVVQDLAMVVVEVLVPEVVKEILIMAEAVVLLDITHLR